MSVYIGDGRFFQSPIHSSDSSSPPRLLSRCLKCVGVEFLKSVPEATYDAIILDAFHVMGESSSLFFFLFGNQSVRVDPKVNNQGK